MCHRCYKLAGESSRYTILRLLAERSRRVGELVERLGLSQPTISYHLKRLAKGGLVKMAKRGREHYFALTADGRFLLPGSHPRR